MNWKRILLIVAVLLLLPISFVIEGCGENGDWISYSGVVVNRGHQPATVSFFGCSQPERFWLWIEVVGESGDTTKMRLATFKDFYLSVDVGDSISFQQMPGL